MAEPWSPEPWKRQFFGGSYPITSDGQEEVIAIATTRHDAERIVSCVNALAGLNPEAIKELISVADRVAKLPMTPDILALRVALEKVRLGK